MIDRDAILSLIPHQGAMCLLDRIESWSADGIVAVSGSHLAAANPLRGDDGRLSMLCGAEYGLQAAAVHGALVGGGSAARRGHVAALRLSRISAPLLDDPAYGLLTIRAMLELNDPAGLIYGFALHAQGGALLLQGSGTIVHVAGGQVDGA